MKTVIAILCLISSSAFAGDIAFGKLKGIKIYDYANSKVTNLHFDDSATSKSVEGCNGVATITHSLHPEESTKQMMSIAIAAYMSGKKVRAASAGNTCELDFLAMQETYF